MSQQATSSHTKASGIALVVGAIGVVFGDIGTSPLYTLKEIFSSHYQLNADHDTVLGVLSLSFWALMMVVTLKYVTIIMRADNNGEGGIMALMALTQRTLEKNSRSAYIVGILGVFGASLFFGDGVITPAISVLSAVEGLQVAAPSLSKYVVPITVIVLLSLFSVQRFGTAKVGKVFGPIMLLWFSSLAMIGVINIVDATEVFKAFNPWWGLQFFITHHWHGIFILGAVVLAVTGGEALYADMGHFGATPIRHSWYFFVLPCLTLNYLGQGAQILKNPSSVSNPFFEAVPELVLYPMIILATLATVIASQSVITGAFSVARQAMQLGYIPRMLIRHTSKDTIGQIYIPSINWLLMIMVVGLVLTFKNSSNLAAAYGISVATTMLIDTLLLVIVASALWKKYHYLITALCIVFFIIDLGFVVANGIKIPQGGWFPLLLGIILFTLMRTWRRGRMVLREELNNAGLHTDEFISQLMITPPLRVEGTAIFLTADTNIIPHALLHNLKHNKILHQRNVLLNVETLHIPYVDIQNRIQFEEINHGFYRIILRFGFMQTPDVPAALLYFSDHEHTHFDPMETTYFASRETIIASANRGMPIWRDRVFAYMHRNAAPATEFFCIPSNRLVELGSQVEI